MKTRYTAYTRQKKASIRISGSSKSEGIELKIDTLWISHEKLNPLHSAGMMSPFMCHAISIESVKSEMIDRLLREIWNECSVNGCEIIRILF